MWCRQLILFSLLVPAFADVDVSTVKDWAYSLGEVLLKLGESATGITELKIKYRQRGLFSFEYKDDRVLVQEIANNIQNLTLRKIQAVKRMVDGAETAVQKMNQEKREIDKNYAYYSTKNCEVESKQPAHRKKLNCLPNPHFFDACVNTNSSSVHVPNYINDKENEVLRAINWTEDLEATFISNYEQDPSLSWQYFGSATGIMRHYPGASWSTQRKDTFDCRLQPWYIEASMNPKDVVILVDISDSIGGAKQQLARHVVNNILDTLGNNDFVHIMQVGTDTKSIIADIDCFQGLVQATKQNVLELKQAMNNLGTEGTEAQFDKAISQAFDMLYEANRIGYGALCCNRAIMIVAGKLSSTYEDTLNLYNVDGHMRVRVFSYHISEEKGKESYEMKILSCSNHGGYEQIRSPGEVRGKVLHYLKDMSTPMFNPTDGHSMSVNRSKFNSIKEPTFSIVPIHLDQITQESQESPLTYEKYHLVTSISMPVMEDKDNKTTIVGVAGTNIPIEELKQLTLPYKLGVNGYAFIVTNNGHLIIHPDLRPEFSGVLKPDFSSIDMTEVEILDNNGNGHGSNTVQLREALIFQKSFKMNLRVKHHYDNMRRVSIISQLYHYTGIKGTPFSVAVALPRTFGLHRAFVPDERVEFFTTKDTSPARSELIEFSKDLQEFIDDRNWVVHPEWQYCKYHFDVAHKYNSPEDELSHFLDRRGLQCTNNRYFSQSEHRRRAYHISKRNSCFCDHDLFMLLINDAMVTKFWAERDLREFEEQGITLAFLATHSGLTRWQGKQYNLDTSEFKKTNFRAIEEVWYKQAVEFRDNFVYLAPFPDEVGQNKAEVTVSQAVFVEHTNKKIFIPVAVAGYRIKHWNLNLQFSPYISECSRNELICYLVDSSGYIVASDLASDTGKFLGELEGYAMTQFVEDGIFKRIPVLDYQAVCLQDDSEPSCAPFSTTPGRHFLQLIQYILGMLIWLITQTSFWLCSLAHGAPINIIPWEDLRINLSRPQSCVKQVDLYRYNIHNHTYPNPQYFKWIGCSEDDSKPFAVQKVPHSNLVLVVVSAKCYRDLGKEYTIDFNIVSDTRACITHNITRRAPRPCVGANQKTIPSGQPSRQPWSLGANWANPFVVLSKLEAFRVRHSRKGE